MKVYKLLVSLAAKLDIKQAVNWYEDDLIGLGEELENRLDKGIVEIKTNPYICAIKYGEIRVKFIEKFPFGLHYLIREDEIKVVAFFHMRRNPEAWEIRLEEE